MPWVKTLVKIKPCFFYQPWSTNVFHPCSTHISMVLSSLATLQKKTRRISCHPWWQGLSRKVVPQASRHSCYQNSTNCWSFIWLYSRDIDIVTMCYYMWLSFTNIVFKQHDEKTRSPPHRFLRGPLRVPPLRQGSASQEMGAILQVPQEIEFRLSGIIQADHPLAKPMNYTKCCPPVISWLVYKPHEYCSLISTIFTIVNSAAFLRQLNASSNGGTTL